MKKLYAIRDHLITGFIKQNLCKNRGFITEGLYMSTIFISSTFQDMQQERDILQCKVLPRIKDFAKQYGKNIELCDLRWGINSLEMDEEKSTMKILQVCFDEIDNARPFFVAIIGDRYGYIPPAQIVKNSITDRQISSEELMDKSVTEMEITYATIKTASQKDARFYFRKIKKNFPFGDTDLPLQYASTTADDKRRMKLLKDNIQTRFPEQVRTYSVSWNKNTLKFEGMDNFAEMIYQDLTEIIRQRWGEPSLLSDYDRQYYQYQFALESDNYFEDNRKDFLTPRTHPEVKKLSIPVMEQQIYTLISEDEYNLNRLFGTLCVRYMANGAEILPYDCSQSVLSSSIENMLRYYTAILSKKINKTFIALKDVTEKTVKNCIEQFNKALESVDAETKCPVILTIRGTQYLDEEDIFKWLPLNRYKNIHFLISTNQSFAGPSSYKEMSETFYFQNATIFDRNQFINAYMNHYHKELDNHVRDAILEKAKGKSDQYVEFLMQRLLVLTQNDFKKIHDSGDGMQKISEYLNNLIQIAPINIENMVLEQIAQLESETSGYFTKAVLAILSILPYGISLKDLEAVLKEGHITYNTLSLTMLCRRLPSVVNVTLDGYYRMVKTPISNILLQILIAETSKWSKILECYMSDLYAGETDQSQNDSVRDFYRSQYLDVAMKAGKGNALPLYLKNTEYDVNYTVLVMHRILVENKGVTWMKRNILNLTTDDLRWMVTDVYNYLSVHKLIMNKTFALSLLKLWEVMLPFLQKKAEGGTCESDNYNYFSALYEVGELAYLHNIDKADSYLLEARSISKANFQQHPNRIWKTLHGIELTEEERHRGYDFYKEEDGNTVDGEIMFGLNGEIEDCELEQSWSAEVRVINNYLETIYRKKGEILTAEKLEAESKNITHMSDPDPQHKGQNEITPYITVVWPDELKYSETEEKKTPKKRAYKPDLRRNSAIQISKEAQMLLQNEKKEDALAKYKEANEILKEIYEDGNTGRYYDLRNVDGDIAEVRMILQKECARDIGINCRMMLLCVKIEANNSQLKNLIDEMISWAKIYDDYYNNEQSKSGLEEYYLVSANLYTMFERSDIYYKRILHDIDNYLTYRLEAHLKGEETDQKIMDERGIADRILYKIITENPQIGPQITDLLLQQSNATVKANDFNGFVDLTNLVESILRWMWENSYEWKGIHCSLEYIYFTNIDNQCMIWEQHHMINRLENDAKRVTKLLSYIKEPENVMSAIQCIMRYQMTLFRNGKYEEAAAFANDIVQAAHRVKNNVPQSDIVILYGNIIAVCSESGQLTEAHEIALETEQLLDQMEKSEYSEHKHTTNKPFDKYKDFIIEEKAKDYLNHAIICSRMGDVAAGLNYLKKADYLVTHYPKIAASMSGIKERIAFFLKNGLPRSKNEDNSEKVYRMYKNQIESALSSFSRKPYTVHDLRKVEKLIQEMCDIPEHVIWGDSYTIAKYYHVMNKLYNSINQKNLAFTMLKKAADIADNDNDVLEVYGEIYSDMCAYVEEGIDKLFYVQKAIEIYERLRKEGNDYSKDAYAMALFNTGVILMRFSWYDKALEKAENAYYIWKELYTENPTKQTKIYMDEAERLTKFIQTHLKSDQS